MRRSVLLSVPRDDPHRLLTAGIWQPAIVSRYVELDSDEPASQWNLGWLNHQPGLWRKGALVLAWDFRLVWPSCVAVDRVRGRPGVTERMVELLLRGDPDALAHLRDRVCVGLGQIHVLDG